MFSRSTLFQTFLPWLHYNGAQTGMDCDKIDAIMTAVNPVTLQPQISQTMVDILQGWSYFDTAAQQPVNRLQEFFIVSTQINNAKHRIFNANADMSANHL